MSPEEGQAEDPVVASNGSASLGGTSDVPPPEELRLEPVATPRQAVRPFYLLLACVFIIGPLNGMLLAEAVQSFSATTADGEPPPLSGATALVGWAVGALVAYLLLSRWMKRSASRPRAPIVFGPAGIELPPELAGKGPRTLPYRALTEVIVLGADRRARLFLEAKGVHLVLLAHDYQHPERFALVPDEVRRRLFEEPGGEAAVELLDREARDFKEALARKPWGTYAIVLVLVLGYAIELATGAFDRVFGLVTLGASSPALVRDGQLERLFVANLLHGGLFHIGLNLVSLASLGGLLERVLGTSRYLVVYLVSGVTGAALSAFLGRHALSVGASTSLFGILGAYFVVSLVHQEALPIAFRERRSWWIYVLGVNGGLSFFVPMVDGLAHLGGFLGGALVALVFFRTADSLDRHLPTPRLFPGLVAALVATYAAAVAMTAARAMGPTDHRARAFAGYHDQPTLSFVELNNAAWTVAIAPDATRELLEAAEVAAKRAVELSKREPYIVDTLAQVAHRLGRHDEAVALEVEALEHGQPARFSTALARFLAARERALGPFDVGAVLGSTVALSVAQLEGGGIEVDVKPRPTGRGTVAFYAAAERGGQLHGLYVLCVERTASPSPKPPLPIEGWAPGEAPKLGAPYVAIDTCRTARSRFFPLARDELNRP